MQAIAMKLLMSLISEAFVKRVVLSVLRWAAEQSSNKVDDEVVKAVEEAWQ